MLTKELKAIDPDMPVIICTGGSERMDEKTAGELGINALLMKPVILKDLARTVREVLDETRIDVYCSVNC